MYVKPFVKRRQKSDARDAAAIVEAAQRPTMRSVAVKTEQASRPAPVSASPPSWRSPTSALGMNPGPALGSEHALALEDDAQARHVAFSGNHVPGP